MKRAPGRALRSVSEEVRDEDNIKDDSLIAEEESMTVRTPTIRLVRALVLPLVLSLKDSPWPPPSNLPAVSGTSVSTAGTLGRKWSGAKPALASLG